jgi:hypothetical protein
MKRTHTLPHMLLILPKVASIERDESSCRLKGAIKSLILDLEYPQGIKSDCL